MRRRTQVVLAAAVLLGAATVFHASLLRAIAPSSMCPVEKPTLDSMEKTRARAMPQLRGSAPAPSHAALGLEIGKTTASLAERASCTWEVPAALLRCDEGGGSLVARFDRQGLLVGLDRQDASRTPDAALRVFSARVHDYETQYGAPHGRGGDATVAFLSSPLRQVGVRYRFEDLAIDVTVTHLGDGVVLREQVREVPAGPRGG
jgi:hypothetical protein